MTDIPTARCCGKRRANASGARTQSDVRGIEGRHNRAICIDNLRRRLNHPRRLFATRSFPQEGQRMKRARTVVHTSAAAIALIALAVTVNAKRPERRFDLVEATIASIQSALDDHVITAKQLVRMYQARIAAYDGKNTATHLNSYIFFNPKAREDADDNDDQGNRDDSDRDHQRPLAGIPMILKDNIDTKDMPTTAGSVAFAGSIPRSDAF